MSALDKKKTITSMSFVPMSTPDISISAAKKQTMFTSPDIKTYNNTFWKWKHEYRTRYSKRFLIRSGFEPSETASKVRFDSNKVSKLVEKENPDLKDVIKISAHISEPSDLFREYMQDTYTGSNSWSNMNSQLTLDGEIWDLEEVRFAENDDPYEEDDQTKIVGILTNGPNRIKEITIDNWALNERTLLAYFTKLNNPDGEWFVYIELYSKVENEVTSAADMLMTAILPIKENNSLKLSSIEMRRMMSKLNISANDFEETMTEKDSDGEDNIDNAYIMNSLSLKNPYEVKPGVYQPEDAQELPTKLLWLIKRRGYATKTEYSSSAGGTETGHIYNLTPEVSKEFYDMHLREQSYLARALFRTFAIYADIYDFGCYDKKSSPRFLGNCVPDTSNGYGQVIFNKNRLKSSYSFRVNVSTFEGKVRQDINDTRSQGTLHFSGLEISKEDPDDEKRRRTYTKTSDSLGYDLLELKVQIDEDHYQVMKITGYSNSFTMSGKSFSNSLGSPVTENKILLPYSVLYRLRFNEYISVFEHSFQILMYATKTVVTKWWKRFLGVIFIVAACIFGGGSGCTAAAIIVKILISVAVTLALEWIAENIDFGVMNALAQVFVVLLAGWAGGGFSFDTMNVNTYLSIAYKVGGKVYEQHMKMQAIEAAEQERISKISESNEERVDNFDSATSISSDTIMTRNANFAAQEKTSTDLFYLMMYGEQLMNFDQYYGVDMQIESRKQVKSG